MPFHTKVIDLDGAGAGSVHVPPSFYVGGDGFTVASNDGADLGTAQLTNATAKFIEGRVDVFGSPDGEAVIHTFIP